MGKAKIKFPNLPLRYIGVLNIRNPANQSCYTIKKHNYSVISGYKTQVFLQPGKKFNKFFFLRGLLTENKNGIYFLI